MPVPHFMLRNWYVYITGTHMCGLAQRRWWLVATSVGMKAKILPSIIFCYSKCLKRHYHEHQLPLPSWRDVCMPMLIHDCTTKTSTVLHSLPLHFMPAASLTVMFFSVLQ